MCVCVCLFVLCAWIESLNLSAREAHQSAAYAAHICCARTMCAYMVVLCAECPMRLRPRSDVCCVVLYVGSWDIHNPSVFVCMCICDCLKCLFVRLYVLDEYGVYQMAPYQL